VNPLQIIYAVVAAVILGGIGWYVWDCEDTKTDYAVFKSNVELLGKKAEADRVKKEADNLKAKENADVEHAKTVADLAATVKRLRGANPPRSSLPSAPTTSSRPDLACFDREQYLREDGAATARLFEGARSLADEGTAATVGLNTAKTWAASTLKP